MRPIRSRKRRARRRRSPRPVHYRPRRYLLTKNETAFFQILSALVPECYRISCKVRLADLVTADRDGSLSHANRISQKHVDFVVSDAESSRIVAAIELDDASHELADAPRPRFFRQSVILADRRTADSCAGAMAIRRQ